MTDRIRAARQARGWSQVELADRAGVTRQLIGAVEAGRHSPNVAAALAIATALDDSVEALFSTSQQPVVGLNGAPPAADGSPVTVGRVGDLTVVIPLRHSMESAERWGVADARIGPSGLERLPDASPDAVVVAGCDPALGVLAGLAMRRAGHRVVTAHASTRDAMAALAGGRAHAVVVHGPVGDLATPLVAVRRFELARWEVGLASGRSGGVPGLDELAARRIRVVQREHGASSQRSFDLALSRVGASGVPGPVGSGHIDVARRVAGGAAAGVTMAAAARSFGLAFTAIETHVAEIWVDARWVAVPALTTLVGLLTDDSFRRRIDAVGGYDLSQAGTERRAG